MSAYTYLVDADTTLLVAAVDQETADRQAKLAPERLVEAVAGLELATPGEHRLHSGELDLDPNDLRRVDSPESGVHAYKARLHLLITVNAESEDEAEEEVDAEHNKEIDVEVVNVGIYRLRGLEIDTDGFDLHAVDDVLI